MELSKLNISSIAKEEIRRRFFDSRSAKNKTSDGLDSSDQRPDEDMKTSEKEMPHKEIEQTVVPRLEEETSASDDDGFPLITSVFSLALSSNETADEGCGSTDKICVSSDGIRNNAGTSQSITYTTIPSSNDVPASNQGSLPFVVKCSPNGVITVCSPPNPTSSSCKFREDHEDSTTMTSSVNGSVCSTLPSDIKPTSTGQQKFPDTDSLPSSTMGSCPNMVTFIDAAQQTVIPVEKPRSDVEQYSPCKTETSNNDGAVCPTLINQNHLQNPLSCPQTAVSSISYVQSLPDATEVQSLHTVSTNLATTSVKTSSVLPSNPSVADATNEKTSTITESNKTDKEQNNSADPSTLHHAINDETATRELNIKDESTASSDKAQPVLTKQEEKIRQLKDLLRQKEAELEKFRFKGETGSVSAAAQLRANFLRKNPSLCQRSHRLNTDERTKLNDQTSTAASSNKDKELDTRDKSELSCKRKISSETESCASEKKISGKADVKISSTSSKQKKTKFTDQDKYKLVNVTILQGHTRTLAVPLESENIATVSSRNNTQNSLGSKASETTTRKRKQQMPRKVGSSPSRRKSYNEEDTASSKSPGQGRANKPVNILNAVSSDTSKPHCSKNACPTGPNTRSSPRRREGHQSLKTTPVKRKSSSTNELKTQNGPSAPKKISKIIDATTCKANPTLTSSVINSKAGPTLTAPKEIYSNKSTTLPSATLNSTQTMTQSNTTLNLKDTKQVTTSSTTGKKVAYVLHMNGAGAATCQSSGSSNEERVKRVVKSLSKEVFALVGTDPGADSGCKGDSKTNNSPDTSLLPGTKVIPQRNIAAIASQSSQESTTLINPTCATNTSVNPTSTKNIPAASCKVPGPMLTIPVLSFQRNKIRNELAKLGVGTNISSASNVPSHSEVNIPNTSSTTTSHINKQLPVSTCQNDQVVQNIRSDTVTSSRQLTVPLVKNVTTDQEKAYIQKTIVSVTSNVTSTNTSPKLSIPVSLGVANSRISTSVTGLASTVAVPAPVTTRSNQVKDTSTESLKSVCINRPASIVSKSQTSTVFAATNRQSDSHRHTGNSLKTLTVNTIAPEVKSVPTALMVRSLAPKYTLTTLTVPTVSTVPIAIASSATNTKNHRASPTKNNANVNPASRPIAPKPTTPQYTSHRFLVSKPTPTMHTSPTLISPKPGTPQSIKPVPLYSNPATPQWTSFQPITAKPTSTQCTSLKLLTPNSTSSQDIASNPTTSEPLNQVINILPKPVMTVPTSSSTAFPENLNNGKIVVYDVAQPSVVQGGWNPLLTGKDGAKLVVYVSNTGDTRNLGIIKDKKIYLSSNQVAAVANQPTVKPPVTTNTSEFIPNPQDVDFKVLLGLEHVVKLLT